MLGRQELKITMSADEFGEGGIDTSIPIIVVGEKPKPKPKPSGGFQVKFEVSLIKQY